LVHDNAIESEESSIFLTSEDCFTLVIFPSTVISPSFREVNTPLVPLSSNEFTPEPTPSRFLPPALILMAVEDSSIYLRIFSPLIAVNKLLVFPLSFVLSVVDEVFSLPVVIVIRAPKKVIKVDIKIRTASIIICVLITSRNKRT
jgi:hypothetical protein